MIAKVNRTTIAEYFERLDGLVVSGTTLYIYGGAAVAALGANIRYDEQDQQDVQFLLGNGRATMDEIRESVGRLPPTFRDDPLVHDNLANLETDRKIWGVA